jgi:FkbM family methyltransferase
MNRRDFLAGAATGVASAGAIGIAARGFLARTREGQAAPAPKAAPAPDPGARPTAAAPPVAGQYKGRVSYAQQGEDLILYNLLRHAMGIENPSYVDIGAGDPVLSNNTYALYLTGSRGVLVEPNPTLVEALKTVRPGDVVVNAGVGVKDSGAADYYVIRDQWPLNTFSPGDVAVIRRQYKEDPVEKVIKMPLIQINRLLAEHFTTAPDLMSLDIEGLDLDVLGAMDFKAHRPAAICAETKKPWESQEHSGITKLLRSRGYVACAGSLYNTIFGDRKRFRM